LYFAIDFCVAEIRKIGAHSYSSNLSQFSGAGR
jgi:hypothetical protein